MRARPGLRPSTGSPPCGAPSPTGRLSTFLVLRNGSTRSSSGSRCRAGVRYARTRPARPRRQPPWLAASGWTRAHARSTAPIRLAGMLREPSSPGGSGPRLVQVPVAPGMDANSGRRSRRPVRLLPPPAGGAPTPAGQCSRWRWRSAQQAERFPRYPRVPVLKCNGYEEGGGPLRRKRIQEYKGRAVLGMEACSGRSPQRLPQVGTDLKRRGHLGPGGRRHLPRQDQAQRVVELQRQLLTWNSTTMS